jgi:hypothetical protein
LLDIFSLYLKKIPFVFTWDWLILVHVCQRWRQITFASPHRLNLQILCTDKTPVRANLDIWPAIPIVVDGRQIRPWIRHSNEDNVIAALEHPSRVCHVWLALTKSQLGKIVTLMQKLFPMLTKVSIRSELGNELDIPCGFLGGSAPYLQQIELSWVSFPALPKLLLSARDLVKLRLCGIPPTSYISSEVMVAHLAALPKLKILYISFRSDETVTSHPAQVILPSITWTRVVLPALHDLEFEGVCDYLEDFMARIDTPQLDSLVIAYDHDFNIEVPQLTTFINRSEKLKQILSNSCKLILGRVCEEVNFGIYDTNGRRNLYISVGGSGSIDQQFCKLTPVISSISFILSDMVHFDIGVDEYLSDRQMRYVDQIEWTKWLDLFRSFSSVKGLSVSWQLAGHVARAFEVMTMTATEVFPALELLCLEYTEDSQDKPLSFIHNFITARCQWDSGHPVIITSTQSGFDRRLRSYLSTARER